MKSPSLCGSVLSALFLLSATPALAIWPAPAKISTGEEILWLSDDVQVSYNGQKVSRILANVKS